MRPVKHPPDTVLRAYADFVNYVFLYLRLRSHNPPAQEELHDLGDAMHNIGLIFTDYKEGDDEKYRKLYLRPFDARWGKNSMGLEQCLQSQLEEHSR